MIKVLYETTLSLGTYIEIYNDSDELIRKIDRNQAGFEFACRSGFIVIKEHIYNNFNSYSMHHQGKRMDIETVANIFGVTRKVIIRWRDKAWKMRKDCDVLKAIWCHP